MVDLGATLGAVGHGTHRVQQETLVTLESLALWVGAGIPTHQDPISDSGYRQEQSRVSWQICLGPPSQFHSFLAGCLLSSKVPDFSSPRAICLGGHHMGILAPITLPGEIGKHPRLKTQDPWPWVPILIVPSAPPFFWFSPLS